MTAPVRLALVMVEVGGRRRRAPAVRLPNGELVIHRTPVLEACRVLIAQGMSPTARFEAWWEGKPYPALLGTVGGAAKLDVLDAPSESPRFVRWRLHPGEDMPRAVEPVAQNAGSERTAATTLAARASRGPRRHRLAPAAASSPGRRNTLALRPNPVRPAGSIAAEGMPATPLPGTVPA